MPKPSPDLGRLRRFVADMSALAEVAGDDEDRILWSLSTSPAHSP